MPALSSHANIYNTCLRILQERGYTLSLKESDDDYIWIAAKGEYDFWADNPIELLGLASIYEYHAPTDDPVPYWWVVKGDNIRRELLDTLDESSL